MRTTRSLPLLFLAIVLAPGAAAAGDDANPYAGEACVEPVPPGLVVPAGPVVPRHAVRPGAAVLERPAPSPPPERATPGTMRVDDGTGVLQIGLPAGQGVANRFDPMDSWDTDKVPPRALRILRIHYDVAGTTPGPLEWHVWEDNGGHKPDDTADLMTPIPVTAQPGWNVVDLEAQGIVVRVDPPRMFEVGVMPDPGGTSPPMYLDDGLPYVGDTGDFHTAVRFYDDQYCPDWKWGVLAADLGDGAGPRSPVLLIWLEVEFDDPPAALSFDEVMDLAPFGSRVAWGDYDGDGWEDLLVSGSRLFRNNGDAPDVTFTEVTAQAGLPGGGNGGIFGDYDNDGDLDIYMTTGQCEPCGQAAAPDRLLRNDGGVYTDVLAVDYADDPGAPVPHDTLPTEGAAWGDFNGDGWLDLYAANHVDWATGECFDDFLWINDGPPDFTFTDVSERSGLRDEQTLCGRGVAPADFDGDGDQDIFVTNYRLNRDFLWENGGLDNVDAPILTNTARARGVEGTDQLGADAYGHGIGAGWGDMDRDGDLDLIVGNLAHSGWLCFSDITELYESSGGADPTFQDIAGPAGIRYNEVHSDASFADWNNDGWLDVFISHVYDGWRSQIYRSLGTVPSTFELVTSTSGIYQRSGWGTAWADYDQDGDLDLASRSLYRNRAMEDGTGGHWLELVLRGTRSNRDAVGARVWVDHGGVEQMDEVFGTRGTSSQDSRIRHFGLGADTTADSVRVRFPSGCELTLDNVAADQRIEVEEPACLVARFGTVGPGYLGDGRSTCVGLPLQFEDRSQGQATGWRWDFDGDGIWDVVGEPDPVWTFGSPGLYQVTLEVEDGSGTSRWTAGVLVNAVTDPNLEDPGNVLRGAITASVPATYDWSATSVLPPVGGDFVLLRAGVPWGPWAPVSPDGLGTTTWGDASAAGTRLLFYRVSVRDPGGCPADDPFRAP